MGLFWLSRKSVGIKLEVEGKTSFVLWQKNISKQQQVQYDRHKYQIIFLVVGVEQAATEIDSSLDELPDKELTDDIHFDSKGSMEPVHVTEFPIWNQLDILTKSIMYFCKYGCRLNLQEL